MNSSQKVVLDLVRKAIDPSIEIDVPIEVNWGEVRKYAKEQGVLGICFDSIEQLSPDQSPDINNLMDWQYQVLCMEGWYAKQVGHIVELARIYEENDIRLMILKGYGLSLNWPIPNHRPTGDVDIYLGELWNYGDQIVHEKLGIEIDNRHEHHTTFKYKNTFVENHYDFINTKAHRSNAQKDIVLKELAKEKTLVTMDDGTEIQLPSPNFNAVFLTYHIGKHFAGAEMILRQVVDWCYFVRNYHNKIDWNIVMPILKDFGIYDFFNHLNAICVDFLGLEESFFPQIERHKCVEERIFNDIFSPEFSEVKPKNGVLPVIWFKMRRYFANSWKRNMIYKDGIYTSFVYGTIAHLKRFSTIKD